MVQLMVHVHRQQPEYSRFVKVAQTLVMYKYISNGHNHISKKKSSIFARLKLFYIHMVSQFQQLTFSIYLIYRFLV